MASGYITPTESLLTLPSVSTLSSPWSAGTRFTLESLATLTDLDNDSILASAVSGTSLNLDDLDASTSASSSSDTSDDDDASEDEFDTLQAIQSSKQGGGSWTRESLFVGCDPVLRFPSLSEARGSVPAGFKSVMKWKVSKFTPQSVRAVLQHAGFQLIKKGRVWLGVWGKHYTPDRFKKVKPWLRVNHFPMSFELGRKDKLYMNIVRCQERFGTEMFDFIPETFMLPRERRELVRIFDSHPLWIIKPPASARGIGVRVISKLADLPSKKDLVVSRYIPNPLLIDNRKFDLRLYVAVTSFEPLRVFFYKEGIVRFASAEFVKGAKNCKNRFMHLTNFSVNRQSKRYRESLDREKEIAEDRFNTEGTKWDLSTLKAYFELQGVDHAAIFKEIESMLVKSILSVHRANATGVRLFLPNRASCYELFGFDVLLDDTYKPWLIEVNISPSLKCSCKVDAKVKSGLITDLFNLVGFRVSDMKMAKEVALHRKKLSSVWTKPHPQNRMVLNPDGSFPITDDDIKLLMEVEDEFHRRGNFKRIFPLPKDTVYHDLFFGHKTHRQDQLLQRYLSKTGGTTRGGVALISWIKEHRYLPGPETARVPSRVSTPVTKVKEAARLTVGRPPTRLTKRAVKSEGTWSLPKAPVGLGRRLPRLSESAGSSASTLVDDRGVPLERGKPGKEAQVRVNIVHLAPPLRRSS